MTHYNTDQLRDYQFGLLDETEAASMAEHLETCAECRAELERIQQQFAVLDLLKEEPEVSESVIASVLQDRRRGNLPRSRSKAIPFRPAVILAAAASIAIIFGVLHVGNKSVDLPRIADKGSSMEGRAPSRPHEERMTQRSSLQPELATRDLPVLAKSKATDRISASVAEEQIVSAQPEPTIDELRAQQPFAPASNIELNVLPRRDDVQLTIYNAEDLTLVRETRKLTLKRGWNWLQFMWSNTLIDPTSLSLGPKTHADQIEITQLVYPPRLNELARWTIFSETNCVADFELTYFTSGLKWNAFYEATLSTDEQSMQLKSFVRVNNGSGEDYEDAQTRLVVGEINLEEKIADLARRQYPYGSPYKFDDEIDGRLGFEMADKLTENLEIKDYSKTETFFGYRANRKEILKQALSEYQLYTIEGRETIPDGWGKRLPSFDVQSIGVTNLYKYDEERWGQNTMRFLSFANTEECKLGDTPLPDGRVRVFRNVDAENHLSYVGATTIKYIPIGEEVELELGTARKVIVKPKLMHTRTDHYEFDSEGNVNGWDEITNWMLEVSNTRNLPVEVEITRETGSYYWEADSVTPYDKYDANHLRFNVQLNANSKQEINYELTVHYGSRMENH